MDVSADNLSLLKVGDLARRTGKTVRAIHHYEELGLLSPASRSKGGYRLYHGRAVDQVEWIQKLQDMGFSLTEIKTFLRVWLRSENAAGAMGMVREIFAGKLQETQAHIARLNQLSNDLR